MATTKLLNVIGFENYTVEAAEGRLVVVGGSVVRNQEIMNSVSFQKIQDDILCALDKAHVSICLAMAWFTNDVLSDKLKEKFAQGGRVEIVVYDDCINAKCGVDLSGMDVVRVSGSRGGIMHDKFCVIDNQVVLHGSYNWSKNAECKNDETLQITEDPKLATKFSVQFIKLRKSRG